MADPSMINLEKMESIATKNMKKLLDDNLKIEVLIARQLLRRILALLPNFEHKTLAKPSIRYHSNIT